MLQDLAIGVDIGGSHISCAAVDISAGKILKDTLLEREVDNQAHASDIISIWVSAISDTLKKIPIEKVKGIGFAMPGPFNYVKGICLIKGVAKYENLFGFNISDAIKSNLELPENFSVRFMNDASSFAVGEAWVGKAADAVRSVSITLGTGFGSAFICNRIPIVDGPGVPNLGCVYHLPFNGKIADESFSTRWFTAKYKEITKIDALGVKEIAELAVNEKRILEFFTEYGDNMGKFLTPWLNSFGAEILVIGGNISNAYDLFGKVFESRLEKEKCSCKVAISSLKEDAAILGSAYLFNEEFWKAVQHALPLM
jgi:glucokinase